MKSKFIFFLFFLVICSVIKSYGQADPGSAGMTFSKSIVQVGEAVTLQVQIGNYSGGLSMGKALSPYDATFTVTIPSILKVNGPLNFSNLPFPVSVASQLPNSVGATVILLIVPNGIPKGANGYVSIPLIGLKDDVNIVYATVKTDSNLGIPSSGNVTPSNDLQSAPVTICMPLPVKLISFEVQKESELANLNWSTSEETNSERFEIEHSLNGKQWKAIGSVASSGDSKIRKEYSFGHNSPSGGENYYRLKMIDRDLTYAYGPIRSTRFDNIKLEIYPNPAADVLNVKSGNWDNISNIQLISTSGLSVYNSGSKPLDKVDVKNLSTGIYLIKITTTDGATSLRKILISR
ncbi:T9SS type A sorting domain-containing protein [Dyadobacter sp. CY345]|uniref:T9SS type A sorting domain-containing protein n=1 Tax=Dyadobacter sp. CY345 TaxID=2909335 RepID=UPI001F284F47|nr:T9SS type A sorting domain-containing protein [Dyadobacter sp. CY345]MCF2445698.1 T9SS type A sorting domain-containing protein [Dyadobacter sp. CY345]